MTTKIALLNGRLYDPKQRTFEKTNILLINTKIVGLGYIPDDDDSTQVDINHHYIFPNIFTPITTTTLKTEYPSNNTLINIQKNGITGSGIIPSDPTLNYDNKMKTLIQKNQQHEFNFFPLHKNTPHSPQMIGLWITKATAAESIKMTIKFNKPLITTLTCTTVKPLLQTYPKATWHIIINTLEDLIQFKALREQHHSLSLSIPAHLVTKTTINKIIPYIKNQLITTISTDSDNQTNPLKCFPLLEAELTISDIYALYSQNIRNLYQLPIKNIAMNHSPHLSIFNPQNGTLHSIVLNGNYSPIK